MIPLTGASSGRRSSPHVRERVKELEQLVFLLVRKGHERDEEISRAREMHSSLYADVADLKRRVASAGDMIVGTSISPCVTYADVADLRRRVVAAGSLFVGTPISPSAIFSENR